MLHEWSFLPKSRAKPQPDFIPQQIRDDYSESCQILSDSPKASAALSRRCLQGIGRDFWNIPANKCGNIAKELDFIKEQMDPDTWLSINAIRQIGNIGAHMEKDVNLIVDIEPAEAALLVEMKETLFEDWYIARNKRSERNNKLRQVAEVKKLNAGAKETTKKFDNLKLKLFKQSFRLHSKNQLGN